MWARAAASVALAFEGVRSRCGFKRVVQLEQVVNGKYSNGKEKAEERREREGWGSGARAMSSRADEMLAKELDQAKAGTHQRQKGEEKRLPHVLKVR